MFARRNASSLVVALVLLGGEDAANVTASANAFAAATKSLDDGIAR